MKFLCYKTIASLIAVIAVIFAGFGFQWTSISLCLLALLVREFK